MIRRCDVESCKYFEIFLMNYGSVFHIEEAFAVLEKAAIVYISVYLTRSLFSKQ